MSAAASSSDDPRLPITNKNGARRYMFTDFNIPQDGTYDPNNYRERFPELVRAAVWQMEKCPTTGKLHIQGYMKLKSVQKYTALKNHMGNIHFDKCQGSEEQCVNYCTKASTRIAGPFYYPSEADFPNKSGKRKDLETIASMINEGTAVEDVAISHPVTFMQMHRGIRAYQQAALKKKVKPFREVKTYVFWGTTGTGKTRRAFELCHPALPYIPDLSHKEIWFDHYNGESTLLLDDFYGQIQCSFMLRLLDGYAVQLPVKGGFTFSLWDRVIITSNTHPNDWYSRDGESTIKESVRAALLRRITDIVEFPNSTTTDGGDGGEASPIHNPLYAAAEPVKFIPPKKRMRLEYIPDSPEQDAQHSQPSQDF